MWIVRTIKGHNKVILNFFEGIRQKKSKACHPQGSGNFLYSELHDQQRHLLHLTHHMQLKSQN